MPNKPLPAVNQRVDIWFEGYDQYYGGRVDSVSPPHNFHVILDDSSSWDVDSRRHIYRLSGDFPNSPNNDNNPAAKVRGDNLAGNHTSPIDVSKQRRSSAAPTSATKNRPGTRSSSRHQGRRDSESALAQGFDNQLEDDLIKGSKGDINDVDATTDAIESNAYAAGEKNAHDSDDIQSEEVQNGNIVSVANGLLPRDLDDQKRSHNPDLPKVDGSVFKMDELSLAKQPSRRRTSGRALRKNTIGPRSRDLNGTPPPFRKSIRSANTAEVAPSQYNKDLENARQFRQRRASSKVVPDINQVAPSRSRNSNQQAVKGGASYGSDGRTSYGRKRASIDLAAVNNDARGELQLLKKRKFHESTVSRGPSTARKSVRAKLGDDVNSTGKKNISAAVTVRPVVSMGETPGRPTRGETKVRNMTRSEPNSGTVKPGSKEADNSLSPEAITAIAVDAALESAKAILDPIDARLNKLLGELTTVSKGLVTQTKGMQQVSLETSDAELDPTSSETEPATNSSTGDKQGGTPLIPMGSLQNFQVDVAEVIGGGEARIKAHSLQALQQFQSLRQLIVQQGQALKQMSSLVVAAEAFAGKSQNENSKTSSATDDAPKENGETAQDVMETN